MEFSLVPLSKIHKAKSFDCGYQSLNDYIKHYALKNDRLSISRTFVTCMENGNVVGYISLSNAQILAESLPEDIRSKLPRYPVPALRIARLAVDRNMQGLGLGSWLLKQAFVKALQISETTGIYAVLVDAIDEKAKLFYLKYGFISLSCDSLTLFLPLQTIYNAVQENRNGF
jgi:GNAT superfamily N-acetyltransferase